jgi:riboflavin synthase
VFNIYIYILRNLVDYMEQFLSRQGSVSQIKQIQITSTKGIVQIKEEEEEEEEELKNLCHRSFQKVLHYFINNLLKTWHKFKKNT